MVVALGPGRFYGSGLPRPRVFPGDRVDPPAPVTDALLCWAREAHWSMGGLGAKRLRLQGRIEGNLVKLRRTARRDAKARAAGERPASLDALGSDDDESDREEVEAQERALRREVVDDAEDDDDDSSESEDEELVALVTIAAAAKRKRARKLFDEFDQLEAGRKKKQKVAVGTPAKASPKKKSAAPAPAAAAPVKASLKKKVAEAKTSPKRKAAEARPAARRTSPRSKH
ncbi:chromatin modification-related protein EAF7-like [Lolium rigidum]|uniref:chromatin modification-related protein EAF7-like n=1 Tax=Lolium rigidum TaxID=89674 RepID=UPI001F5C7218|nr:chromatin modification-related protein EAF7-like [Lolium rigidum]